MKLNTYIYSACLISTIILSSCVDKNTNIDTPPAAEAPNTTTPTPVIKSFISYRSKGGQDKVIQVHKTFDAQGYILKQISYKDDGKKAVTWRTCEHKDNYVQSKCYSDYNLDGVIDTTSITTRSKKPAQLKPFHRPGAILFPNKPGMQDIMTPLQKVVSCTTYHSTNKTVCSKYQYNSDGFLLKTESSEGLYKVDYTTNTNGELVRTSTYDIHNDGSIDYVTTWVFNQALQPLKWEKEAFVKNYKYKRDYSYDQNGNRTSELIDSNGDGITDECMTLTHTFTASNDHTETEYYDGGCDSVINTVTEIKTSADKKVWSERIDQNADGSWDTLSNGLNNEYGHLLESHSRNVNTGEQFSNFYEYSYW